MIYISKPFCSLDTRRAPPGAPAAPGAYVE
jgi:hypothetical protein